MQVVKSCIIQMPCLVNTYVFICDKEALLRRYKRIQVDLLILIDL